MKIIIVAQRNQKEHFTLQSETGKIEIELDREKDRALFEKLMEAYRDSKDVHIEVGVIA